MGRRNSPLAALRRKAQAQRIEYMAQAIAQEQEYQINHLDPVARLEHEAIKLQTEKAINEWLETHTVTRCEPGKPYNTFRNRGSAMQQFYMASGYRHVYSR